MSNPLYYYQIPTAEDFQPYQEIGAQIMEVFSGYNTPNLIVYGGENIVKEICRTLNLLYVEQYMVRMRESREEVMNG